MTEKQLPPGRRRPVLDADKGTLLLPPADGHWHLAEIPDNVDVRLVDYLVLLRRNQTG